MEYQFSKDFLWGAACSGPQSEGSFPGQESMVVDAIKSGARDFIVKPFNAERIVQTVNSILGK